MGLGYNATSRTTCSDLDALADQGLALFEGSYVLSRALGEPHLLKGQLRHFRNYLELVFSPA